MSKSRIVLVLGDDVESQLVERLSDFGITPILHKDDMRAGLNKVRHERFDAVFLDRDHLADADVIEFILNVRDFDAHIPIIATGKPAGTYENRVLLRQSNVLVFDEVLYMAYEQIEKHVRRKKC